MNYCYDKNFISDDNYYDYDDDDDDVKGGTI